MLWPDIFCRCFILSQASGYFPIDKSFSMPKFKQNYSPIISNNHECLLTHTSIGIRFFLLLYKTIKTIEMLLRPFGAHSNWPNCFYFAFIIKSWWAITNNFAANIFFSAISFFCTNLSSECSFVCEHACKPFRRDSWCSFVRVRCYCGRKIRYVAIEQCIQNSCKWGETCICLVRQPENVRRIVIGIKNEKSSGCEYAVV